MGVLNITPDSFSDGGDFLDSELAFQRAFEIQEQGAHILDIGAQSTRPGFKFIDGKTEWDRLKKPLKLIVNKIKIPVSIDTFHPYVAERAADLGVDIINDISGFKDKNMIGLVKKSNLSLIVMQNGPLNCTYKFLNSKFYELMEDSIEKERMCFDPGVGFGKNNDENLYIFKNPLEFSPKDNFVLIGASRKRITSLACNEEASPKKRLIPTIVAHTISAFNGANILRVHDAKEGVQAAKMLEFILKNDLNKETLIQ
jgi:dihydropteroate synthase